MEIPENIRATIKARNAAKAASLPKPVLPKCRFWLGGFAKMHEHDATGNCILKNWSNSTVNVRK